MRELTWDDLATYYDKEHSRKARTFPLGMVFDWAVKQKRFKVTEEGILVLRELEEKERGV